MTAELETLLAEAAITRLIGRYATTIDWMDWDRLPRIFAEDAEIDFGAMFKGDPARFRPFVAALESGYDRRMHMFGLPRIDAAADHARADCANVTHTRRKGAEAHEDTLIFGRYVFEAERRNGAWKLTRMTYYLNGMHGSQQPAADESLLNTADGMQPGHRDLPPAR